MMIVNPPSVAAKSSAGETLITDFSGEPADTGWYVLNDNVMGGRSDGTFELKPGKLIFAGSTNTRGGGFSSIRTEAVQIDLSAHAGFRLRVMGDGRRYTWRLATPARWRGRRISYWADFETRANTWISVDIPFSAFIPKFRGNELDGPVLDRSRITGMGVMIYDDQDGPFELQLARIGAWQADMARQGLDK